MKRIYGDYYIQENGVRIKMRDGTVVTGVINSAEEDRLSEMFTKNEDQFIVVYNATASGTGGKVLFINKADISFAEPL